MPGHHKPAAAPTYGPKVAPKARPNGGAVQGYGGKYKRAQKPRASVTMGPWK